MGVAGPSRLARPRAGFGIKAGTCAPFRLSAPFSLSFSPLGTARPAAPAAPLTPALVWLLAITCGVVVANLYYNQPLLADIGRSYGIPAGRASLVATATQVGYTLGIFFMVPLGDKLERKRLVIWMLLGAAACLGLAAWAPTFGVLVGASVLIGVCSAVPQLLLPLAAQLAPAADRGRIVGRVTSGLLIGILLSRTVSGYVGGLLGWRAMAEVGAGLMVALSALLLWQLPRSQPNYPGSYATLMRSLFVLARTWLPLRRAALVGGLLFAAFSVFWTTLVFFLESPAYELGSEEAGFFGLIGACGALAAPFAGRAADQRGPAFAIVLGGALALAGYAVLGFGGTHLLGLGLGVLILDVGVQATHVANQTTIFALVPEARSRLNTVYMTGYFIGGSLGSVLGGLAWVRGGWPGVCLTGGALAAAALLVSQLYGRGVR